MARITISRKKIDQPAASPPASTIVTRHVEQARGIIVLMDSGSKIDAARLAQEINTINRHQQDANRSCDAHRGGERGFLRSDGEAPHDQEGEEQHAHAYEDNVEALK